MILITDGITGTGNLKAYCCSDIAGVNFVDLLSLVSVHLKDTANTLFLALGSIQNVGTGIHGTGVHTEECQLTYERVGHDLECQSCERLFVRRMTLDFIAIHIGTLDRRDIGRSRHELDNCVQKSLNTFVSVCTTAAYRNSGTLTGSFS